MVLRIETVSPPQILWSNDPPWPCSGPFRGPIGSALLPSSCYNKFPKRDKYMSIYCMCGQVVVANIIQYSVWLFCHSGDLSVLTHIYIFYTALNHPSPTRCYWWQYLSMKSYWLCSLSHYVSLISTEYVGRFSFPCNLQRIIGVQYTTPSFFVFYSRFILFRLKSQTIQSMNWTKIDDKSRYR